MNNLEYGVKGVGHPTKKRQMIRLYVKCLLTLAIAV